MLPDNVGMLRCWEKREIVLKFENGFECPIKAENVTFEVYDDDQISSVRISGDRDYPLGLDEAVEKARFIFGRVGKVPPELDEWHVEVKKRRMFSSFGWFTKLNGDVKVGVQLLPTLQKIDQKPALLGMMVEWKYQGSGPLGGDRSKPVTTPPGFDWDMSYEAWSKRIVEKGSRKPNASSSAHHDAEAASSQDNAKKVPISERLREFVVSGGGLSSWFKWLIIVIIGMVGAFFMKWYFSKKRRQ
jgi:hypothetical protein